MPGEIIFKNGETKTIVKLFTYVLESQTFPILQGLVSISSRSFENPAMTLNGKLRFRQHPRYDASFTRMIIFL